MHIRNSLILATLSLCVAYPTDAHAGTLLRLTVKLESQHTPTNLFDNVFRDKAGERIKRNYSIPPVSPLYVYDGPSIDMEYDLSDHVSVGYQLIRPNKNKDYSALRRRSYVAVVGTYRF